MSPFVRVLTSLFFLSFGIARGLPNLMGADPLPPISTAEATAPSLDGWLKELAPAARNGYEHLIGTPYLPSDFDSETALRLARSSWKIAQRGKAAVESRDKTKPPANTDPSAVELAQTFWDRFGLTARPTLDESDHSSKSQNQNVEGVSIQLPPPLQYVVQEDGSYVMNCFACHGGKVNGVVYPGAPNNRYALQTLTEEVRLLKLQMGKPLSHMDLGSAFLPLGSTRGASNAVMFGVALMHFRDADLNVVSWRPGPKLVNHDMDPPPWWHFKKKHHLYIDGFAQKGHRGLMQFMLVRENGPEKFRQWEEDFREVFEFISSIPSPKYPGPIDQDLAHRGKQVFLEHCSSCHGTYGEETSYPELMIPLDEIGTDPVRFQALTSEHRKAYGESWFGLHGQQDTLNNPEGYVAPPLDGVWATAPYFHNGSVPSLWHLLRPEARPRVWKRLSEETDFQRVGLAVDELNEVPTKLTAEQRREYFDTSAFGKNAAGHDFPARLTEAEKDAVLEYLKTL